MSISTDSKSIGQRIKDLRISHNESQNDLALTIHSTQNSISKMENGDSLTIEKLIDIAKHYQVSLDYLCAGKGGPDLLATLRQYIHYNFESISYGETPSHLIPHIKINHSLFNCLSQIARAKKISDMPNDIKEMWIKKAIDIFNDNVLSDNYDNYDSFILVNPSILDENQDFIRFVEKHALK